MEVYTLKQAARKTKIGVEALRRACQEGLMNGIKLAGNQWRISESALEEALHQGIDLTGLAKRAKAKRPQPEGLRKAQEKRRKEAQKAA
jgi:excisionase family DNA binding protein